MRQREENPGGSSIVTLLVVGVGGYFLYEYLVSSGLWAQWFGGASASTGTAQQIAAGLNNGQFVQAGTDAHGNIIVHQVSNGAYFAVNPTSGAVTQASGPGQLAVGSPGTVVTTPPVTQQPPAQTSTLRAQLQSAANQYLANMPSAGGLNIDQWVFYYQQIKGVTLTGDQVAALMAAAGLSAGNRASYIDLSTFMNALSGVGLSGIVPTPNQGPIRAPIPTTQSFGGGYGGYGNAGRKGRYLVN